MEECFRSFHLHLELEWLPLTAAAVVELILDSVFYILVESVVLAVAQSFMLLS